MDQLRLKYEIKRKGYSIDDFCNALDINRTTFYRKVNGSSEFTQSEIQKAIQFLGLESPMGIFFTDETVSEIHRRGVRLVKGKGCYCYNCQKGDVELVDIGRKTYWDPPDWVCPDCHDDDLTDEWAECESCGKELPMEDMETEEICKECAEKAIKAMREYMENGKEMSPEDRENFLAIWEGVA